MLGDAGAAEIGFFQVGDERRLTKQTALNIPAAVRDRDRLGGAMIV